MKKIQVNEQKIVTSCRSHDSKFLAFSIDGSSATLKLCGDDHSITEFIFRGVEYMEIKELMPQGIVFSCYSFSINECPKHLIDSVNFENLKQYVDNDINIFYADGSLCFELLIASQEIESKQTRP